MRYFEILLFYYITPSAAGAPGEKSQSNQVPLLPEFFMNLATMKISIDEMGGSVNLAKLDDVRIRQRSVSRKGNSSKHPSDFFFEISYVHILPHTVFPLRPLSFSLLCCQLSLNLPKPDSVFPLTFPPIFVFLIFP